MSDVKPYNEKEILELLAQGSQYAYTQLFEKYRPKIYAVAIRMCKSPELAREIVQEVFLRVWQKRTTFRYALNLEPYLYTTARNILFDDLELQAQTVMAENEFAYGLDPLLDPDHQHTADTPYEKLLREAIDEMPPQQRQVFRLAKIEGLKYEAIAQKLGISHFTVKTHISNALQFLRMRLQNQSGTLMFIGVFLQIFDSN